MAVFISYISSWMSSFIWAWVVHIVWASLIQFWIKLCIWIEVCKAMPATVAVVQFSSVQFSCSVVSDSETPWIAACQASLSITNSQTLPKPMSIESVMPSSHLILCRPLYLLPSIPPSIRLFSSESALRIRWPKYCSFSFSIIPSNEYSGLDDWFGLIAPKGRKNSLWHHSSNASVLQCSAFFMVQLSHLYMTTGKTII